MEEYEVLVSRACAALKQLGCFRPDGKLNEGGLYFLKELLEIRLPEMHGPAYVAINQAAGPVVAVECVLSENGAILLSWREHPLFGNGWHTAGTHPKNANTRLSPSAKDKTFEEAVQRCARDEYGVEAEPVRRLADFDKRDNPRFRDVPFLYLCRRVSGEPNNLIQPGKTAFPGATCWFTECPSLLSIQEDYRPYINDTIRESLR